MSNIYVPIRAFGDFTITTAVVKNHFSGRLPVILPAYLKDLYNILDADECYNIVNEIDLKRSPAFFELHKIKTLPEAMRLVREILFINSYLNHKDKYLFDYSNKRLNIFFKHFLYPSKEGSIYRAKIGLLEKYLPKKGTANPVFAKHSAGKKVIFFPGSRKASKVVAPQLVDAIINSGMFNDIKLAYHQSENPPSGAIVFNDFQFLKDIIVGYDLVISADSLPLHMAYYFNIPHFCIYNDYLNTPWLTPYIEDNHYHTVYTGNIPDTVNDINNKLAQ